MADLLDKLTKICPCNIQYIQKNEYFNFKCGHFAFRKNSPFCEMRTDCEVRIDKDLPKHEKLAVLAHETAHAICYSKNCKCYSEKDRALQEYHAQKFALKWLLKNKCKDELKFIMTIIFNESGNISAHHIANSKIMKLKLWKKCLKFIDGRL